MLIETEYGKIVAFANEHYQFSKQLIIWYFIILDGVRCKLKNAL